MNNGPMRLMWNAVRSLRAAGSMKAVSASHLFTGSRECPECGFVIEVGALHCKYCRKIFITGGSITAASSAATKQPHALS